MKYICEEDFKIGDVLIGKKGDMLEVTDAVPNSNETQEDVEGYCDIKNLNTNESFDATWIDIAEPLEEVK